MIIGGTSNWDTIIRLAEGLAKTGAHMFVMKSAYCFNLYEEPNAIILAAKISVLEKDNKEPLAIWVGGKRTK